MTPWFQFYRANLAACRVVQLRVGRFALDFRWWKRGWEEGA